MATISRIKKEWPRPVLKSLPVPVCKGRRWTNLSPDDVPSLIGAFFSNTDAQAVRIGISTDGDTFTIQTLGTSCPPVPDSTISGEELSEFVRFANRPLELWLHDEYWFWVADIGDLELEAWRERFISSKT